MTECYNTELDERLNILLPVTSLKIIVDPSRNELKPFPEGVVCKGHRMLRHFNIEETIMEMFYYYLRNIHTVMQKVSNNDFIRKNMYLNIFLGGSGRQMSLMVRSKVKRLVESQHPNAQNICFLYCFCNLDPRNVTFGPLSYCLPNGTVIDMSSDKGIFIYSEQHNSYLLYGMKIAKRL